MAKHDKKEKNFKLSFSLVEVFVPPPPGSGGDSRTATSTAASVDTLPETYRMSKIGTPNVPKIFIDDDLLTAGSQIFASMINFNEIDRQASMIDRIASLDADATPMMTLESIGRPIWNRPKMGQMRRRGFRPNRYEQSLQGWRQGPPFENPDGPGFEHPPPPPPPHRQRSLRFNLGQGFRFQPRQQPLTEPVHPLENFDSFETFETSPSPPLHPHPHQHQPFAHQQQQRFIEQQPPQHQLHQEQQEQPLQDDYVEQPQPQQQEDYSDQQQDYPPPLTEPPAYEPPATSSRPQTVHYVDVVKKPDGKTAVDGNRGVKTRVYTRITDVTTVGGDENDEKGEEQRHDDEPNMISDIIDQVRAGFF